MRKASINCIVNDMELECLYDACIMKTNDFDLNEYIMQGRCLLLLRMDFVMEPSVMTLS